MAMRYYVNFGTGAGDEWVDGTLEDAKKAAENGLAQIYRVNCRRRIFKFQIYGI